jgi:hypothetical protein
MAYLDFSRDAERLSPNFKPLGGSSSEGSLTKIERDVVWLARRDPIATLERRTGLKARMRRLLGAMPANPLADPRLEALRRFTVIARSQPNKLQQAQAALHEAGYSARAIEDARKIIGVTPVKVSWVGRAFGGAMAVAAAGLIVDMIKFFVGDLWVSLEVAAALLLPIVAGLWPRARA